MSEIKSSNVSWNNIKVNQFTNIQTGYTYITLPSNGDKLAESSGASWKIIDINTLTRMYNSANLTALTTDEVEALFFRQARLVYNNVRSDVINDQSNYPNTETFQLWMGGMFDNRIPGATQPKDGRTVDDNGRATDFNITNTQVPRISTFQTRTSGTPSVPSLYQGPNLLQLASTGNENTYKKSGGFSSLRYPIGKLSGTDYISFSAYQYKARQQSLTGSSGLLGGGANRRLSGSSLGSVQLPIQPNIADNNGVQWGKDSLNFLQAAGAQISGGLIDNLSDANVGGAFENAINQLKQTGSSLLKDPATEEYLKAYFAGKAVGANVLTRATGQIVNPNLELLFSGPSLRSFNFNFELTPREKEEAQVIKRIIRFFKKNMAVQKSSSDAFLFTPNIFKLQYIYKGGGQHPYLNLFKPCALTTFSVQYTPAGTYNTYTDGSMTQYKFAMTFSEIEPIYADDQQNSGGTGY
jgi:hypothetical protein